MIIIGTAPGREAWLADCLASIPGDVIVVRCDGYEPGKIKWVLDHTNIDRFWFLQDSVVIHDPTFLTVGLNVTGATSLCACPREYGSFMGVYDRHILEQVGIEPAQTKADAIAMEISWTSAYVQAAGGCAVMFPDLSDANATGIEPRHGRENLVLSNEAITKYKGTWK